MDGPTLFIRDLAVSVSSCTSSERPPAQLHPAVSLGYTAFRRRPALSYATPARSTVPGYTGECNTYDLLRADHNLDTLLQKSVAQAPRSPLRFRPPSLATTVVFGPKSKPAPIWPIPGQLRPRLGPICETCLYSARCAVQFWPVCATLELSIYISLRLRASPILQQFMRPMLTSIGHPWATSPIMSSPGGSATTGCAFLKIAGTNWDSKADQTPRSSAASCHWRSSDVSTTVCTTSSHLPFHRKQSPLRSQSAPPACAQCTVLRYHTSRHDNSLATHLFGSLAARREACPAQRRQVAATASPQSEIPPQASCVGHGTPRIVWPWNHDATRHAMRV